MFAFRTCVNSPRGSQTGVGEKEDGTLRRTSPHRLTQALEALLPGGWLAEQPVGKDRLGPSEERLVSGEV